VDGMTILHGVAQPDFRRPQQRRGVRMLLNDNAACAATLRACVCSRGEPCFGYDVPIGDFSLNGDRMTLPGGVLPNLIKRVDAA
jgi:hypothetical protein